MTSIILKLTMKNCIGFSLWWLCDKQTKSTQSTVKNTKIRWRHSLSGLKHLYEGEMGFWREKRASENRFARLCWRESCNHLPSKKKNWNLIQQYVLISGSKQKMGFFSRKRDAIEINNDWHVTLLRTMLEECGIFIWVSIFVLLYFRCAPQNQITHKKATNG